MSNLEEMPGEILKCNILIYAISCILVLIINYTKICFGKEIRTVANLRTICPRHKGFGLAKTSVASGQRGPELEQTTNTESVSGVQYLYRPGPLSFGGKHLNFTRCALLKEVGRAMQFNRQFSLILTYFARIFA